MHWLVLKYRFTTCCYIVKRTLRVPFCDDVFSYIFFFGISLIKLIFYYQRRGIIHASVGSFFVHFDIVCLCVCVVQKLVALLDFLAFSTGYFNLYILQIYRPLANENSYYKGVYISKASKKMFYLSYIKQEHRAYALIFLNKRKYFILYYTIVYVNLCTVYLPIFTTNQFLFFNFAK